MKNIPLYTAIGLVAISLVGPRCPRRRPFHSGRSLTSRHVHDVGALR
jgi:hypothetical protein